MALSVPRGKKVRPTSARIREALFSIIGDRVMDAGVLDLFAGSGILGIEAVSRGASSATFVDSAPAAAGNVRLNIKKADMEDNCRVMTMDFRKALRVMKKQKNTFDLVFLDPPYAKRVIEEAVRCLVDFELLRKGAMLIAEYSISSGPQFPEQLHLLSNRRYGSTGIDVYDINGGDGEEE